MNPNAVDWEAALPAMRNAIATLRSVGHTRPWNLMVAPSHGIPAGRYEVDGEIVIVKVKA